MGFSRDSSVLRVKVSYKVMKGIILVAGRVTEVYWWDLGGSKEFLRGSGGLLGGLIYPDGAIFAPLEVYHMTKIGSKFHKMVQLAKLHWVRITDPIWDIWTPLGAFKRPFF